MGSAQEELKRQVVEHLEWDQRVDAATIGVQVHEANVVLSGTVPSFFARMAAEYDAWSVPGVSCVINQLEVTFRHPVAVPSDDSIRARILDTLLWNPNINAESIDVAIEAGTVTLTGTTDALWKKVRIEEQVGETLGVRTVRNQLRVVPRRRRGDDEIAGAIRDALSRSGLGSDAGPRVRVDEGRVRLEGRVRDRNAYIAAENVARHTLGVVEIDNTLQIEQTTRYAETNQ